MTSIPLRELRNNASAVLRRVEAGERITVMIDGRPVADMVPHPQRRQWVPRDELMRFLSRRKPDPTMRADVRAALSDTTDDV
jgi:prevent-host-death family protein